MHRLIQSPRDPAFVQNPYPVYADARAMGPLVYWDDYGMMAAFGYEAVNTILRDRRFGREVPADQAPAIPDHLKPFYAVEAHSMLELEPPRHTRLRGLVVRAFTSKRIAGLGPEVTRLSHDLIDRFPAGEFDLLTEFAQPLPVMIIADLLGVPRDMADQFLSWSHDMVAMYMAGRDRGIEDRAATAAAEFSAYLSDYIDHRRSRPGEDLITALIAAEEDGTRLSRDELITTCILLLNAGHEATVHTIGNGVHALIDRPDRADLMGADRIDGTVEEILRYDPPLHMFTRYAYEDMDLFGHHFRAGDQVALMLGAANRDPTVWDTPEVFDPSRPERANAAFGAGLHFCIGAPLARLELVRALPVLFERCSNLRCAGAPAYGDTYHFHGLSALPVRVD